MVYKSSTQSIKILNVVTRFTAYKAEHFQNMGHLLDRGAPRQTIWEEIWIQTLSYTYSPGLWSRHGCNRRCKGLKIQSPDKQVAYLHSSQGQRLPLLPLCQAAHLTSWVGKRGGSYG